jgi:diacylglycerol kinase (ATP)
MASVPEVTAMSEPERPGETGTARLTRPENAVPRMPASHGSEGREWSLDEPSELTAHGDRWKTRSKLAAGWRGLKAAIRGDSSFFAHGYRGTLIVITAALLRVDQRGWCLLVVAACLVLIAELGHSAVDALARAVGDPEEPRLQTAREIAAAGVLVAAFGSGAVTLIVLTWKFIDLLAGKQ